MLPKLPSLQMLMQLQSVSHVRSLRPFPFWSGFLSITLFSGACIMAAQFTVQKHLATRPEARKQSSVDPLVFTGTWLKFSPMQGCVGGYAQLHVAPGQTPLRTLAYSLRVTVCMSLTVGPTPPRCAGGRSPSRSLWEV